MEGRLVSMTPDETVFFKQWCRDALEIYNFGTQSQRSRLTMGLRAAIIAGRRPDDSQPTKKGEWDEYMDNPDDFQVELRFP